MATTATLLDTPFKKEVFEGLSAFPKYLSSKYFYDKKKLFRYMVFWEKRYR